MMKLHNTPPSNEYYVSNPVVFNGCLISMVDIDKVVDFAYEMCFGEGHHRASRTGGQYGRKAGEMFCNTFQGKIAEVVLYNFFKLNGLESNEPDFGIYGKGIWDDSDLVIKGKKINVKSAALQSNLLLLETKDWNVQGQYIPNLINGSTSFYDYFILVRIGPDVKKLFSVKRYMYLNEISKTDIQSLIKNEIWKYDLAGYITNSDLVNAMTNNYILPQNSMLNKWTKMDAENYYIQSGDMRNIQELIKELKEINN